MSWRIFIEKLRRNWKYPAWWSELILSGYYHIHGNDGDNVMDYKWDNLIILDACSCEAFLREFSVRFPDQTAGCRISNATCTLEFLMKTFTDDYYSDIVYITGNPYPNKVFKNKFYKIIPVWVTGWDEQLNTVPPENMLRATLSALKKYPNKRFVIHFMQPHFPYVNLPSLDDSSMKLFRKFTMNDSKSIEAVPFEHKPYLNSPFRIVSSPIYLMGTREDHLRGYYYNLRRVLDIVERLLRVLPGKTLVTADHGDAFGEIVHPLVPIRVYGHPWNIRIDILKKVPMWIVTNEEFSRGNYSRKQLLKELHRPGLKHRKTKKATIKNVIMRLKHKGKL